MCGSSETLSLTSLWMSTARLYKIEAEVAQMREL